MTPGEARRSHRSPHRVVWRTSPGLAPAYVEVGELDLFRDESVTYAQHLWAARVSTELHVRPGLPHGFDNYAIGAPVTERTMTDRVEALRSL